MSDTFVLLDDEAHSLMISGVDRMSDTASVEKYIVVRDKTSLRWFNGPTESQTALTPATAFQTVDNSTLRIAPVFSPDATYLAIVPERGSLQILSQSNGYTPLYTLAVTDAQYVHFSPKGRFLVSWSLPYRGSWKNTVNTIISSATNKSTNCDDDSRDACTRRRLRQLCPYDCVGHGVTYSNTTRADATSGNSRAMRCDTKK